LPQDRASPGRAQSLCHADYVEGAATTARDQLPVACTLGADGAAARLRRWQALSEQFSPRVRHRGHILEIKWLLDEDGAQELEALVVAERECCAFVTWSVNRGDPETILRITASESRPQDAAALAILFEAS
jgi:hypothetical protein